MLWKLKGDLGGIMKLTKRLIDSIRYEKNNGKRDVRWDSELMGFGIRVYPSGKKTFVLSYWLHGRKRLMALGRYGVLSVELARKEAIRNLLLISDCKDPLSMRVKDRNAAKMKDLCTQFLERHSKVHKRSWKEDERRINAYVLPAWKTFQLKSITKADVVSLHQKIGKHSIYDANRTISLLGTMFKIAMEWDLIDVNGLNPARGIQKFKEVVRDRWVTPEEMPKLAEAIDSEKNIYARFAIWLYLLTGLRKSELLGAKWDDINWTRKEICIRRTKNGDPHYVPLSEPALAFLKRVPMKENNPFIIAGQKEGSALVNISKPWLRIRKAAGVTDVRIHDLRRTTGSWLAQKGNSLHLIARVLNHRSSNTTKIYARFAEDNVRVALESHGKEILSAANVHQNDTLEVKVIGEG